MVWLLLREVATILRPLLAQGQERLFLRKSSRCTRLVIDDNQTVAHIVLEEVVLVCQIGLVQRQLTCMQLIWIDELCTVAC